MIKYTETRKQKIAENLQAAHEAKPQAQWISCKEYPNYLFSTKGDIFSLSRARLIKPYVTPEGKKKSDGTYSKVSARIDLTDKNGKTQHWKMHKLMIYVFRNWYDVADWNAVTQIHHRDRDVLNWKPENLIPTNLEQHKQMHALLREIDKTEKIIAELIRMQKEKTA